MVELKTNKKAFDSQVKIYKSLRRLLLVKPMTEITVADISAECGISRSSFYRNFNNTVEVLEAMFDYFYKRYLDQRKGQPNQLLFFFQYWVNHRDLVTIISQQNEGILKRCIKKYDANKYEMPYLLDLRVSILSSILAEWSRSKKHTPEQMYELTKEMLNKKCLEILLEYDI